MKNPGERNKASRPAASSNWLALQKNLPVKARKTDSDDHNASRKRRKLEHSPSPSPELSHAPAPIPTPETATETEIKNGESLSALRKMIFGNVEYTESQQLPGKYLALDCEMVGVGLDGSESSLARVSIVNFYGAVQLDEFVRQRERVVDYRTQYSGVRAADMANAKPFEEIQKQVAELLEGRILIGHAVFNDLKALLLSHPRPQTRDTQFYAGKFKVTRSRYVALRNLAKQELGVTIQGGEHSSVTDARATMAVYRLHRKEWEKGTRGAGETAALVSKKRKQERREEDADDNSDDSIEGSVRKGKETEKSKYPGGGRKGVSSGLSTVVRHGRSNESAGGGVEKTKWWKELATTSKSSKGSIRVKAS